MRLLSRLLELSVAILVCSAASAATNYWPTCDEPQPLTPASVLSPLSNGGPVVWNGFEFAVLYTDGTSLHFQRVFADGTPAAEPIRVPTTAYYLSSPLIVWNGRGYGVAWWQVDDRHRSIYFALLAPDGTLLSTPVEAANLGLKLTLGSLHGADLAWGDGTYLLVYGDDYMSQGCIRASKLDSSGSPVYVEQPVYCRWTERPTVIWSAASRSFIIAWYLIENWEQEQAIYAVNYEHGTPRVLVSGAVLDPELTDSSVAPGIAWRTEAGGSVYFALLNPSGPTLITDPAYVGAASHPPVVAWTGAEFGVFLTDRFFRVSYSGVPVGPQYPLPIPADAVAFAGHGYLLISGGQPLRGQTIGCHDPSGPLCPESVDSYSISGSSTVISWLPVPDDHTDIAYYQVYRNNVLVGRTAEPFFNDTTLSPGVTYDYDIRTVNAAQMVSAPCPASNVSVTTSDALQLRAEKGGTDVLLSWYGANAPAYRVMRGTSPRSMTEIQRTTSTQATDPGAAAGAVCYFYSVDPPK